MSRHKKRLSILALIGARSGSKGVRHKNIKPLAGKPLIGWIIESAKKSKYINRVIVSTDSVSYQKIARSFGAETPFLRPVAFATDRSPEFEYVCHALAWLKEHEGYEPDIVCRLLPTVPFQKSQDIDATIKLLLRDTDAHSAVVVSEARQHPEKALKLISDGKRGHYVVTYGNGSGREVTPIGRQQYGKAYFRANVITFRPWVIEETGSLTGDRVRAYVIPQERAIDIDNQVDFEIADFWLRSKKETNVRTRLGDRKSNHE